MKAIFELLYVEYLHDGDSESNLVSVNIHQWARIGYSDVVCDTVVIVDGETVIQSSKILSGKTNAGYQRHGMKVFDKLLEDHPVLGPLYNARGDNGTL